MCNNFINASLYLYTFTSNETPYCCHVSLFLSGSSTGSVCGLDCWGAQGGSALTVGGNSFRKYQTARHTHSHTQSTVSLSFSSTSKLKLCTNCPSPLLPFFTFSSFTLRQADDLKIQFCLVQSNIHRNVGLHVNLQCYTTQKLGDSQGFYGINYR